MKLWSNSFKEGQFIPTTYAFCEPDATHHTRLAPNCNPHLAWSDVPQDTQSLVLLCVDPDAPVSGELVNKKDEWISEYFPRTEFYHWVIINLPARDGVLEESAYSSEVSSRGKSAHTTILGSGQEGLNDYTTWFAGETEMEGSYAGYDGPCPPWNDQRIHRYQFKLYALSIPSLAQPPLFDGRAVMAAIQPHILDTASLEGQYTLNASLLAS